MRKSIVAILSLLLTGRFLAVSAETLPVGGGQFLLGTAEIVWRADTNKLPASLWVYKEIPASLSPMMLSNLAALGEFRESDKKKVSLDYPIRHKSLIHFENKERTRRLDVIPAFGWIDYSDAKAIVSAREDGPIDQIPTPEEALDLAIKYSAKMGISRSELATMPSSSEIKARYTIGHRSWYDKDLSKTVRETNMFGVNLIRKLDGFDFAGGWGSGGVWIDFGNRGRVALMKISWRNLQRYKSYSVASPKTIMERITHGEATIVGQPINPAELKRLVIKTITPFYWAGIGYSPQEVVYPFAVLGAEANLGHTNVSFELNCPLLIDK